MLECLDDLALKESEKLKKIPLLKRFENHLDKWSPIYGAGVGALPGIIIFGSLLYTNPDYSKINNWGGLLSVSDFYMGAFLITCFGAGFGALLTAITDPNF